MLRVLMSTTKDKLDNWLMDLINDNTIYATSGRHACDVTDCVEKMCELQPVNILELSSVNADSVYGVISHILNTVGSARIISDDIPTDVLLEVCDLLCSCLPYVIVRKLVGTRKEAERVAGRFDHDLHDFKLEPET